MRLPRKLKKGCRTLNGNPRTKWQRKGRLHTSAQVVDAYSVQTPMGEISMTLVAYMWPTNRNENANLRNDYTGNYAPDGDAYSFTSSRADFS